MFVFDHSDAVAKYNRGVFLRNYFDQETTLHISISNTHLQYGSEFRYTEDLKQLLNHRPLRQTKSILDEGVNNTLIHHDNEEKIKNLHLGLDRGKHKGATAQPTIPTTS